MSIEQADSSFPTVGRVPSEQRSRLSAVFTRVTALPELLVVLAVAGVLNLWDLSINGTANSYYAAAVKSMASSWHDFLYNSMDKSGLMTVDKPPLSDWIQALSVRVFGYSSWSLLVPQALMGVLAAGLAYDLVRRRFGRVAGFVAGFALATTPTIVAVSRHNNPDELLVLLSVAAVWFALRAIETGKTRWIVWSGVMVGLGFETKMGVALMIVPGIALAYLWMCWTPGSELRSRVRGNLRMIRQLAWGGLAMLIVGLAWPVLVTLTPAADRPWISGTADNSVWSLIFSYNGVGRIAGQTGGPSGGGMCGAGSMFGGGTGVFRLLGSSLGSQAGWLLGAAVVSAIALAVMSRLRRSDPRTGFVVMIGVTLAVVSVVFSFASGIFHPYYVSMVAPWAALLIGAGVGEMHVAPFGVAGSARSARIVGAALVVGGAITELVVIGNTSDVPGWATPVTIIAGLLGLGLLIVQLSKRARLALAAAALVALFATPVAWATETLGHATSGTFPTGGPASAESGFGGGGMGGRGGSFGGRSGSGFGGGSGFGSSSSGSGSSSSGRSLPGGSASGAGSNSSGTAGSSSSSGSAVSQLFNSGSSSSSSSSSSSGSMGVAPSGSSSSSPGGSMPSGTGGSGSFGGGSGASGGSSSSSGSGFGGSGSTSSRGGFGGTSGGFGGMGGAGGSSSLEAAAKYAEAHGGGTVVVESQSTAAEAMLAGYTNVAGIGGFSGNESTVSASWIAKMVSEGRMRYILGGSADSASSPSDGRAGSKTAIEIAESVAKKITVKIDGQTIVLYDLQGKAAAILAAAAKA